MTPPPRNLVLSVMPSAAAILPAVVCDNPGWPYVRTGRRHEAEAVRRVRHHLTIDTGGPPHAPAAGR